MFTQFINLNYLNNIIREPIHKKKKIKKIKIIEPLASNVEPTHSLFNN